MEEGETASMLSRKELRKQKLMEYLVTKGQQKLHHPNSSLRVDCPVKKPVNPLTAVMGKENQAPPAQRFGFEAAKVKPLPVYRTEFANRVFRDSDKGNVKIHPSKIQEKQKNEKHTSVLRSTYSVITSKPNPNAPTCVKKQANTSRPCTAKASNVGMTTVQPSNSRFTSRSNVALSGPVNVRMSLGPLVKTKTGLIPAVTQPRNTNPHLMQTFATAPDNINTSYSVAKKTTFRPLSSLSQRTSTAQNRIISNTASRFRKVEGLGKSNLKPLLVKHFQPPCKSQMSKDLKSAPLSSRCEAATIKPQWKAGMAKTTQSASQNTDRSTKQTCQDKGKKNDKLSKTTSQRPLGPSTRCSSNGVSGAAVTEMAAKTMMCKSGRSSASVLSQQTGKKSDVKVMSKTVPHPPKTVSLAAKLPELKTPKVPARAVSLAAKLPELKTPKVPARAVSLAAKLPELKTPKVPVRAVPQTDGKKLTAAQEQRMKKLQEWREAKGISYKRPPMPVKPQVRRTMAVPQPFWTAMKEEDEAQSLIQAVDRALADCIKLLEEGCSPEQVKKVLTRLPAVSQKFAKYWICQARLMEQEGNFDVLPMFKEAVHVVLEPVDELRTVVFEILKKKDEIQEKDLDQMPAYDKPDESCNNPTTTPEPVGALINGEKGDSSVVKFKITATPSGALSRPREAIRVNGQEVRFFTPVRRSVRIERASVRYPASLQDQDLCVASYSDLISKEEKENNEEESGKTCPSVDNTPMYIYRQNEALKDKVFVQLVYDEVI